MPFINFAGIKGNVTFESPHGNYIIVKLSQQIYICGTYSNKWKWSEVPDAAPFLSFITYIGGGKDELMKIMGKVYARGGTVDEMAIRPAKRVRNYPYEIKCRELTALNVRELLEEI